MEKNHFSHKLGNILKTEREKRGISQEKLAEIIGIHRTYIGMIERGERNITVFTLIKVCKSLKIKPEDIIYSLMKLTND